MKQRATMDVAQKVMGTTADSPGVIARPPLLYGAALLAVVALRWFWPIPITGQPSVLWLGIVLAVLSISFGMWARRSMLDEGTNIDPMRPTTAMVTSGPFRLSRNPIYLAFAFLFIGLTLALNTWWGLVALVPLLLIMHLGVVLREERYLEMKFGDAYGHYKTKVSRYIGPI